MSNTEPFWDSPEEISTLPSPFDNAPYFPAFVPNSCSAIPIACAAAGINRIDGPSNRTRVPIMSLKWASCESTRSSSSTPRHAFCTSKSWLAASPPMRSVRRATNVA